MSKKTTKKSIRWAAASASAVLLTTALAACQSGGNEPASGAGDASALPSASSGGSASPAAAGAGDRQTVTVAVFTEDRFLKQAVEQFEQTHPDIDVQIQETVPTDTSDNKQVMRVKGRDDGPSAEDKDKYVNGVGTALMSGNAADLISTSYLPVDRYLDKGMFADWSELAGADADFKPADYYEKVLKGMSDDRGWYAIPVDYTLNVLIGNGAVLEQAGGVDDKTWAWESFIALCEKLAGTKNADGSAVQVLGGMQPEEVVGYVTQSVYDKLVTRNGKRASFDEAAFKNYLELVKKLYDSGAVSADDLGGRNQVFSPMNMERLMDLAALPGTLANGQGKVLTPPGSGQDEGIPFESDLAFALNARSEVKPAAWEFVKFLLSEEIQSSPALEAFPVNQAAARARLEDFAKQLQSGGAKIMIKDKDGPAKSLSITDEQIEQALALLPSVGKYERTDDKVLSMIEEEAANYFSGSKTAEAVAKAVASRVNTYLNE